MLYHPSRRNTAAGLNLASAAVNFTSIVWSLHRNGPKCLGLYSDLAAIFSGAASLAYARYLLRGDAGRIAEDREKDSRIFRRLRFASVCAQTLVTGLSVIAANPVFAIPLDLKAPHLILMHFVGPGLSYLSFFGPERDRTLKFPDTLWGYYFTLAYTAIAIPLAAAGIADIKAYPFLNYAQGHRLKAVLMDIAILTVAYLDDAAVWRLSQSDRDTIEP